jgi:hypothetical protein
VQTQFPVELIGTALELHPQAIMPFPSERAFYRYAQRQLRTACPQLPDRSQFNRLLCEHRDEITAFGLYLISLLHAQKCYSEVLDSTAAVTRDANRRGTGWLTPSTNYNHIVAMVGLTNTVHYERNVSGTINKRENPLQ